MKIDIDALSNHIRKVDGNNTLGAGALAEKIAEYLEQAQAVEPAQRCNCCGYLVTDSEHRGCLRAAQQEQAQAGWLRAIDEALVMHDVGVANADDTYEQAKDKLNKLLVVVQDIGAYFAKQEQAQAVPTSVIEQIKRLDCSNTDTGYVVGYGTAIYHVLKLLGAEK